MQNGFMKSMGDSFVPGINLNGEEYGQIRLETDVFGNIKKNGTLKPNRWEDYVVSQTAFVYGIFVNGVKAENICWCLLDTKFDHTSAIDDTEFLVAPGPFHIVMTSDGSPDVMHPEDPLIRRHDVTSIQIKWTSARRDGHQSGL